MIEDAIIQYAVLVLFEVVVGVGVGVYRQRRRPIEVVVHGESSHDFDVDMREVREEYWMCVRCSGGGGDGAILRRR